MLSSCLTLPKSEFDACQLEQEHVHKVYNEIAHHFSNTRHKPWAHVVNFLHSFPNGSLILDVGCGNGKYMNIRNGLMMIGCDRSEGFLKICRNQNYQVFRSDCMNIPVPTNLFDGVICIAVLHHISTEKRRFMVLKEIVRLLKPGGQALVTVWAKEQEIENKQKSSSQTEFEQVDCLIPTEKLFRYYHVFIKNELEHILNHISQVKIINSYNNDGNWCVRFMKIV